MKRVLFIAYHFPPLAGGGTFRSLKFVKYLPEFGWLPTVITTNSKNYWAYDNSLLDEIPKDVKVIRAPEIDPFYLQIVLSKFGLLSLYKFIRDKFLIPDEKIGWIPLAYKKANKELKKNKYDLIFSTSPTPCAHIIAYKLKQEYKLPWVADYRDQWTNNPEYNYISIPKRKEKDFNIEKLINNTANRIISVTRSNHEILKANFNYSDSKALIIYNGFDNDIKRQVRRRNKKFSIIYTGTFYGDRNPKLFLDAIRYLIDDEPELQSVLDINFFGKSDFNIDNYCTKLKLQEIVHHFMLIPRNQLTTHYLKNDVFLLIIPHHSPNILTSKLFDYLSYQKPILAIIPNGEAKTILKKSNLGYFAYPNSVEDIKNQLLNLYHLWGNNKLRVKPNIEYIKTFHRRNLTKQLAKIFDSIT